MTTLSYTSSVDWGWGGVEGRGGDDFAEVLSQDECISLVKCVRILESVCRISKNMRNVAKGLILQNCVYNWHETLEILSNVDESHVLI
jgi:hypothetical protein